MTEIGETPEELRDEVEREVEDLAEAAAAQERARLARRQAEDIDEPR